MQKEKVSFLNKQGEKLVGIFEYPQKKSNNCVICCHGFTISKNQVLIKELAKNLAQSGITAFRFDFSGNGESEGDFGDASYIKEASDLKAAINFIYKKGYKNIGVVGHSMGGAVSLLASANNKKVKAVAELAGVAFPVKVIESHFDKKQIEQAHERGSTEFQFWKKSLILNKKFFDDLHQADVLEAVRNIKAPLLIIHGLKDNTVPFDNAQAIFEVANEPKEFHRIPNANHFFAKQTKEVVNLVNKWMKRYLAL